MSSSVVVGSEKPKHRSDPEGAVDWTTSDEVVEFLGRVRWPDGPNGEPPTLDEWQLDIVRSAFARRADGRWAAFEVALVVPRQNGKTRLLSAIDLAAMLVAKERLIVHSAHEVKTVEESFLELQQILGHEENWWLEKRISKIVRAAGREAIWTTHGGRLKFVARNKSSGRGLSGDRVIFDEALLLDDKAISAQMPTMRARPNAQLWYTSSAPDPGDSKGDVLRRTMRRGRSGESTRLAYFEWCADDDAALDDERAWAESNPAYGRRIEPDSMRAEYEAMAPDDFARELLGIVDIAEVAGQWAVVSRRDWSICGDPELRLADPVTFGVDTTPERSSSSICASDGVGVDLVANGDGTAWVVDRLAELSEVHGGRVVVDAGSPAASFLEELHARGVPVVEANTMNVKAATAGMFDALVAHELRHVEQAPLTAAAAGATKRQVGDSWLWNRRAGVDITPLVAATLARWGAHLPPEEEEPPTAEPEVIFL